MVFSFSPEEVQALARLRTSGQAVYMSERDLRMLYLTHRPTWQFDHAILGPETVFVSPEVQGPFYEQFAKQVLAIEGVARLMDEMYRQAAHSLVWGFVGHALPGESYELEFEMIATVLESLLEIGSTPALIVDGGQSAGVPALAAVLGRQYGLDSLGFTQQNDLVDIGPRAFRAVRAGKDGWAAGAIGSAADVLVSFGGGLDEFNSIEKTLSLGGVVFLLHPRVYAGSTVAQLAVKSTVFNEARSEGRVLMCATPDQLPDAVTRAHNLALRDSVPHRSLRLQHLYDVLTA